MDEEEAQLLNELQRVQRDIAARRAARKNLLRQQLALAQQQLTREHQEDAAPITAPITVPITSTTNTDPTLQPQQVGRRRHSPAQNRPDRPQGLERQQMAISRHLIPGRSVPEDGSRQAATAATNGSDAATAVIGPDVLMHERPARPMGEEVGPEHVTVRGPEELPLGVEDACDLFMIICDSRWPPLPPQAFEFHLDCFSVGLLISWVG